MQRQLLQMERFLSESAQPKQPARGPAPPPAAALPMASAPPHGLLLSRQGSSYASAMLTALVADSGAPLGSMPGDDEFMDMLTSFLPLCSE